mmetsp:Transcript_42969/g.108492  ORF Transcript_42969/g.108492 Transcript_42969/m.108492 type:complete len:208 (-) Transcript_42969:467-1090(-)
MREQLLGAGPLGGALAQRAGQKVEQLLAPLIGLAHGGAVALGDEHHGAQHLVLVVRRHAVGHLDESDAQRPDVGLAVVGLAVEHLGAHEERRADGGLRLGGLGELRAHAKVGDLELAAVRQQQVVRLEVAVDQPQRVQVGDAVQRKVDDGGDLLLAQRAEHAAQVGHRAQPAKVHHHPERVALKEAAVILDDVGVRAALQDVDLVLD